MYSFCIDLLPEDSRPRPISCSLTETVLQILSELEFVSIIELECGSAVKCGTMNTNDPTPIITAPANKVIYLFIFG